MDMRQYITQLATKLRKQFAQVGYDEKGQVVGVGVHAIVRSEPHSRSLDEGFEGDPMADTRPDFVKQDEIGWTTVGVYKSK